MPETVSNYNLSTTSNFKLEIPNESYINYFLQTVTLPSISNTGQDLYYTNNQTVTYSNVTEWSPLNVVVLMDEEFECYTTLYDWMRSFIDDDDWRVLVKDIKLSILSSNKKNLLTFTFAGALPTMLGDVNLDNSNVDTQQVIFNVEFRYQYFTWERIKL